jgi:DNA repair protein RecO (recombination protein O)
MREGRDLSLVSQAEIEREFAPLRNDVIKLAYASAVLELVDLLVSEREPDPALFDLVVAALGRMSLAGHGELDAILWLFEISLASALGYGPELTKCVSCGKPPGACHRFSAKLGGLVCEDCIGEIDAPHVSGGRAVQILAKLAEDGAASDVAEVDSVTRDEVADTLGAFLEIHAGRSMKLRSMDFLAQLRRMELLRRGGDIT